LSAINCADGAKMDARPVGLQASNVFILGRIDAGKARIDVFVMRVSIHLQKRGLRQGRVLDQSKWMGSR
jgi:hypothetical protein